MTRRIKGYGYIPDLPDQRDLVLKISKSVRLPTRVDLIPQTPMIIYDQGNLGSCTANAIACAMQFDFIKQKLENFIPSRLFIYYNERVMEGTVKVDAGAMLRDGIKSVNKQGVCKETTWPYQISKFATKPNSSSYKEGLNHLALKYESVPQTLDSMRGCLASGYPFVAGFTVYESFESWAVAQTGIVNLPQKDEATVGGHAILVVGYNDASKRFICRNSWGINWGIRGHFTIPYPYLTNRNLANDFWKITVVK